MLKDNSQMVLDLSPYQGLYEVIIPRDHILRKLKNSICQSAIPCSYKRITCSGSVHNRKIMYRGKAAPLNFLKYYENML